MSKVCEYLEQFSKIFDKKNYTKLIFRGQANSQWALESSAFRRLKRNTLYKDDLGFFVKYHERLIWEAKKGNFSDSPKNIENLCDLEILAFIQHYGGATCLIDFTSNFLMALWFATNSCVETSGNVFIIDIKSKKEDFKNVESKSLKISDSSQNEEVFYKSSIDSMLNYKYDEYEETHRKKKHFWYWEPRKLDTRIFNQHSIFVFGFLDLAIDKHYQKIEIKSGDKVVLRNELKKYFDINTNSVYYDFHGFSMFSNGVTLPVNDKPCIDYIEDYYDDGYYDGCIKYIDFLFNCRQNGNFQECLFNVNCSCDKEKGNIYYIKGKAIYQKKKEEIQKYIDLSVDSTLEKNDSSIRMLINDLNDVIENYKKAILNDVSEFSCCIYNLTNRYFDLGRLENSFHQDTVSTIYNFIESYRLKIASEELLILDFNLLELCILSKENTYYEKILNSLEKINERACNAFLLIEFFKGIHQVIVNFRNNIKETLDNTILVINNYIEKNEDMKYNKIFQWNFGDIKSWSITNSIFNGHKKEQEIIKKFIEDVVDIEKKLSLSVTHDNFVLV